MNLLRLCGRKSWAQRRLIGSQERWVGVSRDGAPASRHITHTHTHRHIDTLLSEIVFPSEPRHLLLLLLFISDEGIWRRGRPWDIKKERWRGGAEGKVVLQHKKNKWLLNDSSLKSRRKERKGQSKGGGGGKSPHFSINLTQHILAFYPLLRLPLITRYTVLTLLSFIFVWAYLSSPSLYPALSIFSLLSVQIHVVPLFSLCASLHISQLSPSLSPFFSVWPHLSLFLSLSQRYQMSSFSFSIVLTAEPKEAH